jgi:hypothetical protein
MSNVNVTLNQNLTGKKTKEEWYKFINSDVINFLVANNLDKITVDDGCGQKAVIRINKNGEYKIQITSSETL